MSDKNFLFNCFKIDEEGATELDVSFELELKRKFNKGKEEYTKAIEAKRKEIRL